MHTSLHQLLMVVVPLVFVFGCNRPDNSSPIAPHKAYESISTNSLTEKIEKEFFELEPFCHTTLKIDEDRTGSAVKNYKASAKCHLTMDDQVFSVYQSIRAIDDMKTALRVRTDVSQSQLNAVFAISIAVDPYFTELAKYIKARNTITDSLDELIKNLGCEEREANTGSAFFRCREFTDSPTSKLETFPHLYAEYMAKRLIELPELACFPNKNDQPFLLQIERKRQRLITGVLRGLDIDKYLFIDSQDKPHIQLQIENPEINALFTQSTNPSEVELKNLFTSLVQYKKRSQEILKSVRGLLQEHPLLKTINMVTFWLAENKADIRLQTDEFQRSYERLSIALTSNIETTRESLLADLQNIIPVLEERQIHAPKIDSRIRFQWYQYYGTIDLEKATNETSDLKQLALLNDQLVPLIEKYQTDLVFFFGLKEQTQPFSFDQATRNDRAVVKIYSSQVPFTGEGLIKALSEFLEKKP